MRYNLYTRFLLIFEISSFDKYFDLYECFVEFTIFYFVSKIIKILISLHLQLHTGISNLKKYFVLHIFLHDFNFYKNLISDILLPSPYRIQR